MTLLQRFLVISGLLCLSISAHSQTRLTEVKTGHVVSFAIPEYMSRTVGINSAAFLQFKSAVKDLYTFVIEDSKEELALVEMKFSTCMEFYDFTINDFLVGEKNRKVSTPKAFSEGGVNFVQSELTYYDKEAKADIYYNITVAETGNHFYQILSFTSLENSAAVKEDCSKLALSLREVPCN
jgi:hypothetical protein